MLWSQQELLSARFLPPCHGSQVMATGPHHPSTAHNEPCLVSQTSHWQLYKFWDYYWLAHCPRQYGSVSVSSNIYKYLLNEFVQDLSLTNIIPGPVNTVHVLEILPLKMSFLIRFCVKIVHLKEGSDSCFYQQTFTYNKTQYNQGKCGKLHI